ncbi:MAG: response regulator transcription factor [Chloroflexi bacterium]|nr:response regulator transcription factor [Chloroflexota bacterium]
MTDQIRVMIADDHPMFRKGLTVLLKSLPGCEVVAEAEDGASVVQLALQHEPDVILMDVRMPELNGIEATRQIFKQCPRIGILILTMFQDDDLVLAAMKAGARGYLLKGADQDEIIRAIETVKNGGAIFSASIADRMMNYFSSIKPVRADGLFPELTEREIEVLDLIAKGYNNTEIAEQLVLSNKTVRNHVSNILSKLQAADRSEAIRLAWSSGLGQRDNSDLR